MSLNLEGAKNFTISRLFPTKIQNFPAKGAVSPLISAPVSQSIHSTEIIFNGAPLSSWSSRSSACFLSYQFAISLVILSARCPRPMCSSGEREWFRIPVSSTRFSSIFTDFPLYITVIYDQKLTGKSNFPFKKIV